MSRPSYETSKNLSSEARVAGILAGANNATSIKLPAKYPLDWALVEGKAIVAFIEVKCRTNSSTAYAEYMISLAKYASIQRLSEMSGVKAYLAVQFTDRLMICRFPDHGLLCEVGGRTDRGDSQDIEPVVLIPMTEFTEVSDKRQVNLSEW